MSAQRNVGVTVGGRRAQGRSSVAPMMGELRCELLLLHSGNNKKCALKLSLALVVPSGSIQAILALYREISVKKMISNTAQLWSSDHPED